MMRSKLLAIAIATALVACSGGGKKDDGGGGGGGTPSPGPASGGGGASDQVGSILARGGQAGVGGASGTGGHGGVLLAGAFGEPITFKETAGLPAKPGWTRPELALGANPRTVAASTTLALSGQVKGDDGANPATSLWVKPGVTLTLSTVAPFSLPGPIIVEGTLDAGPGGSCIMFATHLAVAPGGLVLARGGEEGPGGRVIALVTEGLWIFGDVDARGGDGDAAGGEGGVITLGLDDTADATLVVAGELDASGGGGGTGLGGPGGTVTIGRPQELGGGGGVFREGRRPGALARPAPDLTLDVHVTGSVSAHGGGGTSGGPGGGIQVNGTTATVLSGALDVSGGGATTGLAGRGGRVDAGLYGGPVWVEGSVNARGGAAGVVAAAAGGLVALGLAVSVAGVDPSVVYLSADVDASGGAGKSGGRGGQVALYGFAGVTAIASTVDVSGSDGAGNGAAGSGGEVSIESIDDDTGFGPVSIAPPILADAGSGDTGGNGGQVSIDGSVVTCDAISANAGDSLDVETLGGDGGSIRVTSDDGGSVLHAPLSVVRGQGADPGAHGTVIVDGTVKTLVGGVFTP